MSKNLNVAVIIKSELISGGGYQYERTVLNILKKFHNNDSINFIFYSIKPGVIRDYSDLGLDIQLIKENFVQKLHRFMLLNLAYFFLFKKFGLSRSCIENRFLKDSIDLIYFLSPDLLSLGLSRIPYIFTLWDLGHLERMEFPEISYDRSFEIREELYSHSLKKAFKVIVDSSYSKKYTREAYNIDCKRLKVLKYLPSIRSNNNRFYDIKKIYKINNNYIFYPAIMMPHKNHIYILKAVKILKEEENILLDIIFSGSDRGNLSYILDKAKEYGISQQLKYIGFAPDEHIPCLYQQSLSLVMPTYLGPTNVPPLEAFFYKVPVCYSDTEFFREQVGDAVFYMDLFQPRSLSQHLLTLVREDDIVKLKVQLGTKVLEDWSEENFYRGMLEVFKEYAFIRESWGKNIKL
jgi:glycosyltransferase involved in cell wall biosynthesis